MNGTDDSCTTDAPARAETLAAARALGLESRLRAWRGRSGRRYVVSTLEATQVAALGPAVALAVGRDAAGRLCLRAALAGDAAGILADPRFAGAEAIDVHLLAPDEEARQRVVADLVAGGSSARPG